MLGTALRTLSKHMDPPRTPAVNQGCCFAYFLAGIPRYGLSYNDVDLHHSFDGHRAAQALLSDPRGPDLNTKNYKSSTNLTRLFSQKNKTAKANKKRILSS